ncbi:hypothetical protein D7030_04450 [Flavobacteriaceae bacterium AU392]|nr:hypothetical protein D1817_10925 [Flavobacteriaceae bacterium]RKM85928.1 hypothetical protein D7030_04450 [Flavobacteriaceae bacterium AU392]
MITKEKHILYLYESIGKLFYAIAACDHTINKIEKLTLNHILTNDWKHVDKMYRKVVYKTFEEVELKKKEYK